MIRGTRTAETVLRAEGPSPRSRNASFACAPHLGRRNCAKPLPTRLFVIRWLKKIRFRRSERGDPGTAALQVERDPEPPGRPRGPSPVRFVTAWVATSSQRRVRAWGLRVDVWRCGGMEVGAWGTAGGGLRTAVGGRLLSGLTGGPSYLVSGAKLRVGRQQRHNRPEEPWSWGDGSWSGTPCGRAVARRNAWTHRIPVNRSPEDPCPSPTRPSPDTERRIAAATPQLARKRVARRGQRRSRQPQDISRHARSATSRVL